MPHSKTGFRQKQMYSSRQPRSFHFASQRFSFWIATVTLLAFVMGNMVGQHGWYAFWKSVLGKTDDSLIVFTGTVAPIEKVPDYERWAAYGGDASKHTFRMVPSDVLIPLPAYVLSEQRETYENSKSGDIYSVGNLGSYDDGADGHGSHVGTDIRTPVGTPVDSIANGIVQTVRELTSGYGKYIVIRHPNVPDSSDPMGRKKTTVYSIYAHLDSILVTEGDIVHKGQQIGFSGQTGFATGPHLHFQIDNDQAPWHPYWPFTSTEASEAHMTFTEAINAGLHQERGAMYTMNPMLFVQQFENDTRVANNVVSATDTLSAESAVRPLTAKERMLMRRAERLKHATIVVNASSSFPTVNIPMTPTLVTEAPHETPVIPVVNGSNSDVDHIEIQHDGYFGRGWERVTLEARDANENTVTVPSFPGKIYLRTGFGDAEFRPDTLTSADFHNGRAVINVLPRGSKRSLIIDVKGAFTSTSTPLQLER